MVVRTYFPSSPLASFVEQYVIVSCDAERINRLLPGPSISIAFRLKGTTEYIHGKQVSSIPSSVVSGLRKTPRFVHYQPQSETLIVQFRTAAAASFFKIPLHELFEENISLDHVIDPSRVCEIEDALHFSNDDVERISIAEHFLLTIFQRGGGDLLVRRAVDEIVLSKGVVKIRALADHLCISQDAFEKRFRKSVGSTAKQFSAIIRLQNVIRQKPSSFTDLALASGYFDSAHFNKEFKQFTSQTPKEFFALPVFW